MGERTLDRILVRDLVCRCIVGVNPDEREKPQEVKVNLVLHADLSRACTSDDIKDTVDYKNLKMRILDLVEHSSFYLVERLAQAVADVALAEPLVQRVQVTVDKPGALRFARSVAIEILRER